MNPKSIPFHGHVIESACSFYEENGQWSVRCIIVGPDGRRSSPIACPDPAWCRTENEAVLTSLSWGAEVVRSGEW